MRRRHYLWDPMSHGPKSPGTCTYIESLGSESRQTVPSERGALTCDREAMSSALARYRPVGILLPADSGRGKTRPHPVGLGDVSGEAV